MTNTPVTSNTTPIKASDQAGPAVATKPSLGQETPVTSRATWAELNNRLRTTPPSANGLSGCMSQPKSPSESRKKTQDIETVIDLLDAYTPKRKRSITHFEGISLAFLEAEKKKADAEKAKTARPVIVRKRAVGLGKLLEGMSLESSGPADPPPGLTPNRSADVSSDEEEDSNDEDEDEDDDLLVVVTQEPTRP